ncbi:hypothetical protein EYF80_003588 [Liparis tanakae]|uniref:Uncharacterized protein n=1 Tax=Liparis tanakae TaxID=230148 RepID=A0A4Z2J8D5_9TELE|nr:hypothetical protein EYF80_003588 [Liparis tanakae]
MKALKAGGLRFEEPDKLHSCNRNWSFSSHRERDAGLCDLHVYEVRTERVTPRRRTAALVDEDKPGRFDDSEKDPLCFYINSTACRGLKSTGALKLSA